MENIVNLQLSISTEDMQELLMGKLASLPDEKVHEVICGALGKFLQTTEGTSLFVRRDAWRGNRPTELLETMIANSLDTDVLHKEAEKFVNALQENYPDLVRQCLISTFSKLFFDNITRTGVETTLTSLLERMDTKEDKK